jgi:hypothetical protein
MVSVGPAAARSEAWALDACALDRGFEFRSGHGGYSPLVSLRCAVLCRYRPVDGLIPRPGGPTVCRKLIGEAKPRRGGTKR